MGVWMGAWMAGDGRGKPNEEASYDVYEALISLITIYYDGYK
jgi:hypothetical protein